jgi:hypothetical protein
MQIWMSPRDMCALLSTEETLRQMRGLLATQLRLAPESPEITFASRAFRRFQKRLFQECTDPLGPTELDGHVLVRAPRLIYMLLRALGFCTFQTSQGDMPLTGPGGHPVCLGPTLSGVWHNVRHFGGGLKDSMNARVVALTTPNYDKQIQRHEQNLNAAADARLELQKESNQLETARRQSQRNSRSSRDLPKEQRKSNLSIINSRAEEKQKRYAEAIREHETGMATHTQKKEIAEREKQIAEIRIKNLQQGSKLRELYRAMDKAAADHYRAAIQTARATYDQSTARNEQQYVHTKKSLQTNKTDADVRAKTEYQDAISTNARIFKIIQDELSRSTSNIDVKQLWNELRLR